MEKFEKQSYEEFPIAADFVNVMDSSESLTLSSCAVEAEDKDGSDVSSTVLDQTTLKVDGTQLKIVCKAGSESKSPYKITFKGVTDATPPNKWEVDVRMEVEEI